MPVGFLVVSFLLLCQALLELRAGRITTAGLCLGALAYTTMTLRSWYQTRGTLPVDERESVAPCGVLVAIVYPDEIGGLGRLLAAVDPASQPMTILAVSSSAGTEVGANVVAEAGGQVALMSAAGRDPALVVLEVALRLRASRVVVLRAEDTSIAEQRRRCTVVWEGLPSPRPALHVEMVAIDRGAPAVVIELGPAPSPQRAS